MGHDIIHTFLSRGSLIARLVKWTMDSYNNNGANLPSELILLDVKDEERFISYVEVASTNGVSREHEERENFIDWSPFVVSSKRK